MSVLSPVLFTSQQRYSQLSRPSPLENKQDERRESLMLYCNQTVLNTSGPKGPQRRMTLLVLMILLC